MSTKAKPVAGVSRTPRSVVGMAQAGRRTGLGDSALSMAGFCARREVATQTGSDGRPHVDLRAFAGPAVEIELAALELLESGRL
jgi:hypothetical protein